MESTDQTQSKPNVLLVEDTLTQALLIQHQLKRAGYSVKLARSAKAAIDELSRDSYGLILSDINMPEMNGFELCKHIKAADDLKEIPFVLLATPVEKDEIIKMIESGADNFILKSYDEASFLAKLDEILKTMILRQSPGGKNKAIYNNKEIELGENHRNISDFMLSSFEIYLQQISQSKKLEEES